MSSESVTAQRLYVEALAVVGALQGAGFRALFVGGCVRDGMLGLPLKDIDIATDARPQDVMGIFTDSRLVGAKFGVVLVQRGDVSFEVATFRRDGVYVDHRHPESVSFGSLEDDAQRRDFTINGMFHDPISGRFIDLVGGKRDLEGRIVRCIGEPRRRFAEDALRLLRAVRFAARFDFQVEAESLAMMKELAPTIQYVTPERQREELTRILQGPRAGAAFRMMLETGFLHWLLPEIEAMSGVEQGALYHPEGDVFTHTMLVVDFAEPRTVRAMWSALLHDVGKPLTFQRDSATGKISFREHARVGAEIARLILERLKFASEDVEAITSIVARHMNFSSIMEMRTSTLRRFLGAPTIEDDLAVHRADCLGSSAPLTNWEFARERLEEFASRREEMVPKPFITGNDLLSMGMKPGPAMGAFLHNAHERQLNGEWTSRNQALDWLRTQKVS
ncbi:CCA tRNA nucleotidyltransferase [Candidatus Sumerlaeota bacterium]|nr:CCA tRNA nucleotidyltransferase [Candidatus Sumerlaeota bacterium]